MTISEKQVVSAPLRMLIDATAACRDRPDIDIHIPLNWDSAEYRTFEGEGDPPKELMDLAHFGRR